MGQRHQLFVVAKVGSRYRVLATVHHYWLWADRAVSQCLLVLKEFSRKANLPGIRRELVKAKTLDWENDIWLDEHKNRAYEGLFPFIATCLFISSTVDNLGENCTQAVLIPINWDCYGPQIVNDDGITIIDISEPEKPRYGFLFPHDNVLMDAAAYFRAYTHDDYIEEVGLCDEFGNVSDHAVRSLWPGRNFKVKLERVKPEVRDADVGNLSLRNTALTHVVDAAFESPNADWLAEAELLQDFQAGLFARLTSEPERVNTLHGKNLLARAIKGQQVIDLSSFQLSASDILRLVADAWSDDKLQDKKLILPNTKGMSKAELKSIVQDYTPSTLNLGETPGISLRKLFGIVSGSSVVHFTCSSMYRRSLELISHRECLLPNIPTAQFPCGISTGFPISQMIFLRNCNFTQTVPRLGDGSISWFSPRNSVWTSEDYKNTLPLTLPLPECLISPERTHNLLNMAGLLAARLISETTNEGLNSELQGLAKELTKLRDDLPIQPLPAEMYRQLCWVENQHPPKHLEITQGQWTFLVTCEADYNALRHPRVRPRCLTYSFVTLGEDGKVQTMNAGEYFKAVMPDNEDRKTRILQRWRDDQQLLEQGLQHRVPGAVIKECSALEVEEAMQYLDNCNAAIDAYEEANKDLFIMERERRLRMRAEGQLRAS